MPPNIRCLTITPTPNLTLNLKRKLKDLVICIDSHDACFLPTTSISVEFPAQLCLSPPTYNISISFLSISVYTFCCVLYQFFFWQTMENENVARLKPAIGKYNRKLQEKQRQRTCARHFMPNFYFTLLNNFSNATLPRASLS